ncbi:hypothetical protein F4678DRAFT_416054 [Xylaria arbuscula]|nr:hypothetical protein F4678DRAFT_416054 [Xylaria arbuscula]
MPIWSRKIHIPNHPSNLIHLKALYSRQTTVTIIQHRHYHPLQVTTLNIGWHLRTDLSRRLVLERDNITIKARGPVPTHIVARRATQHRQPPIAIMATPQSTASGEAPKNNLEQITFRFCSECSNMLYPKEDEDSHKLMFTCRTCQYTEEATSSCVFRHVLNSAAGETAGVTQDVGSDPTLPRSDKTCPACQHHEAVYFQSQQRSAETGMKLFYVCCECGHIFQ